MKVLFLSSWFPNRVTPLNGDFVERHALAVSKICHTAVIHVASDNNISARFFEVHEIQKDALTEIIVYFKRKKVPVKPVSKLINNAFFGLGYVTGYRRLIKKFGKPDIIHGNIIFPISVIAWLFSILIGIPYILSEHWTIYLSGESKKIPDGLFIRKAVRKSGALVPVTWNLQKSLAKLGYATKYYVVPNVVDTEKFKPGDPHSPEKKKRLLHVSSMKEDHKNISGIIRTIKRLHDIRNDFICTFAGEASDQQQELAVELGLSGDTIVFAGEVTHDEVATLMQKSHFLVMFSRIENLPCVILEALSCGIPVISSDVGGISEWISTSNGILVKPGDEDALLEGLVNMMDNYEKYNPEKLHRFAIKNFSPAIIAGQFNEIYLQVMQKKAND